MGRKVTAQVDCQPPELLLHLLGLPVFLVHRHLLESGHHLTEQSCRPCAVARGLLVGLLDGQTLGELDGDLVGLSLGDVEGLFDGLAEGLAVGCMVGDAVGGGVVA